LGALLLAGTFVRFWGLDNVGLHGDEETMALAARGVLETGEPILPSGLFYGRAPLHTYMMAGSAALFGESEWSWRLPSAIVGSLMGLVAFFLGRRFLPPVFNLGFVATIVFWPPFIELAQTARMYVFLVTGAMLFAACLFHWERDGRILSLLLAIFVWLVFLQFHQLMIFVGLLFFFPALSRTSMRLLWQGSLAFFLGWQIFKGYRAWIGSNYPAEEERLASVPIESISGLDVLMAEANWAVPVLALTAMTVCIWVAYRDRKSAFSEFLPIAMILAGVFANIFLHYHVGVILIVAGIVGGWRFETISWRTLGITVVLLGVVFAIQMLYLHQSGLYPGRKILGALIGQPSIWPVLRFGAMVPAAAIVMGVTILYALDRLRRGLKIPSFLPFFILAVWAPLFLIGFFAGYPQVRYMFGQVPFFLLAAYGALAWFSTKMLSEKSRIAPVIGSCAFVLSTVNPTALLEAINPTYGQYPDHKGAAEYVVTQGIDENVIIIAEDVIQQAYYLPRVDYWLHEMSGARSFSIVKDGLLIDQYTGSIVLGSGDALRKVLADNKEKEIFIIGSGENFHDGVRRYRGDGIADVLQSDQLDELFVGRDGRTRVWKSIGTH
jgi:4-amino-4-deoxy-L-arabinose transferase-like glycosyltransferase